jgi:Homeodomain-like domain
MAPVFSSFGPAGLEDEERPGRPCVYDHDDVLLLVKLVTEEPPDHATRWSMEALATKMARHGVPISPLTVLADLQRLGLEALVDRELDDLARPDPMSSARSSGRMPLASWVTSMPLKPNG